jgi:ketosteroid isomerase-like protein
MGWALALWASVGLASAQQPAPAPETELPRIAQALVDAVALGDTKVWDRYLDDACVITDENGDVTTKAELLAQMHPLPSTSSGSIRVTEAVVHAHGDTAVLTHLDVEDETYFGQKLHVTYRSTDTYVRRDGQWRMVSSQIMVIPNMRKSVAVDAKILDAVVGTYELAPGVDYVVARKGDGLVGQRTGRGEETLRAANETTFYREGTVRGEKVFVRDSAGRVTEMLDRRDNNDIVWKRVK